MRGRRRGEPMQASSIKIFFLHASSMKIFPPRADKFEAMRLALKEGRVSLHASSMKFSA